MNLIASIPPFRIETDPLKTYQACKALARDYAEAKAPDNARVEHARSFCSVVLKTYWHVLSERHSTRMKMKQARMKFAGLDRDIARLAEHIGALVAEFPVEDAGYLIGSIYTVMLPSSLRSELGAYYTPPPLVARLLDLAEKAGFDFRTGSAIDPACGGGAFLAPTALRMVARMLDASPSSIIQSVEARLRGIELDAFAAWMTRVLLDAALMPICKKARRRLADVVIEGNALELAIPGSALSDEISGKFDLAIGNPPYGRVTLDATLRQEYSRSLYGHANLYGLFTDLALRLVHEAGVIAYLTPTSFLGGQYYKSLRSLLAHEATPCAFDFVADREGVFDDVLQETMLTTYRRPTHRRKAMVSLLVPKGLNSARVERIGEFSVERNGNPWILPRSPDDTSLIEAMSHMPTRLGHLGFAVSTGQLVWNRHKEQLRLEHGRNTLPIVWAESVLPEGFSFNAKRRQHVPFINVWRNQSHLITKSSCILVQRTTSKEQDRRIVSALLPQSFIDQYGGVVVENHLNMVILATPLIMPISLETLVIVLNSNVIDRCFRCISGSVAVSAYELQAVPLPSEEELRSIERMIKRGVSNAAIERAIARYYGAD